MSDFNINEINSTSEKENTPVESSGLSDIPEFYEEPTMKFESQQTHYEQPKETSSEPEVEPEPRKAYSDAGYVSSADAAAVPKSYYCAVPPERKEKKAKKERRGMSVVGIIALCLACVILGGVGVGVAQGLFNRNKASAESELVGERSELEAVKSEDVPASTVITKVQPQPSVSTNVVAAGDEMSATDIYYDLAINQVVGVKTEITYTNYFGFTSSGAVSGSGFIISPDGYILTNNHVISEAVAGGYEVKVLTYDGSEYIATVVGYEEDNDVAVLKINADGLNAATIGNSDDMRVGQKVYAVGNPLGELEYTMTDGMVSALDREISSKDSSTGVVNTINMFQISAAINSGNSGGPVYNSRGEVIGIATAKYSDTGIEGLGFAIPINDAVKIADDLIADGYVRGKAYMGVSVGTVTASAAQYYGLVPGAIISSVYEGSCAENAGLQENDIVVEMDGKEITSKEDLISAKKKYRAGDTALLKVYRGGEYLEMAIIFDEETPEILETENQQAAEEQQQQQQQQQQIPSGGNGYDSFFDFFNNFFGGSSPFGR